MKHTKTSTGERSKTCLLDESEAILAEGGDDRLQGFRPWRIGVVLPKCRVAAGRQLIVRLNEIKHIVVLLSHFRIKAPAQQRQWYVVCPEVLGKQHGCILAKRNRGALNGFAEKTA